MGGIAAVFVAGIAVWTAVAGISRYRDEGRERSGRWLTDLQQRFVNEPSFQVVRREIYNGDESDLTRAWKRNVALLRDPGALASDPLTDQERKLLVALDDYLEFLGLLERLIEEGGVQERDAYTMFGWYGLDGTATKAINAEIEGRNFPK